MTHEIGTREQWLKARLELLEAEKEHARQVDELAAFIQQDGAIYHTYSAYARGLGPLWNMYQWLDRAPLGRNESGIWWKRNDEYGRAERASA